MTARIALFYRDPKTKESTSIELTGSGRDVWACHDDARRQLRAILGVRQLPPGVRSERVSA
jgi:hypothetical protein